MGYSTMMFGVDLDQVHKIITERDTDILATAKQADPESFEHNLDDSEPTAGEALAAIINGGPFDPNADHQYGYAFKLMCATIGEWLPDDDMIGDLEPLELQSPLETFRCPIDIPANQGFPFIAFLTADEVKQEANRLRSIDLSFPMDEDIEEAREAYANCVNEAAEKNLAIVTFYY